MDTCVRAHGPRQGSCLLAPDARLLQPGGGIDLERLHAAGHPVIVWTVNDLPTMQALLRRGVDGIISDRPDLLAAGGARLRRQRRRHPGDLLDADGLIDPKRFDAQGHRGARNLRPENTLPAFEAALDHRMTTLELDTVLTADGVAVLSHDPDLVPAKCRHADGSPLTAPVSIATLTVAELQATLSATGSSRTARNRRTTPPARRKPSRSPTAPDSRTPTPSPPWARCSPSRRTRSDAGRTNPRPAPRPERPPCALQCGTQTDHTRRQPSLQPMATRSPGSSMKRARPDGADVQSFDLRAVRSVQERHPELRTAVLLEDDLPPPRMCRRSSSQTVNSPTGSQGFSQATKSTCVKSLGALLDAAS